MVGRTPVRRTGKGVAVACAAGGEAAAAVGFTFVAFDVSDSTGS